MEVLGGDGVRLAVPDLDAAIVHYGAGLGLPLRHRDEASGTAVFSAGLEARAIVLRVAEPDGRRFASRVWLEVADARAAAAEVRARGVAGLSDPLGTETGWSVEVPDPWGNVVTLSDHTLRPEVGRRARRGGSPSGTEPETARPPAIPEGLLAEALETLSVREQEMLRYRFGLKDGAPHTLDETGRAFRVTRDRVRQVETKLIRQLQRPE